MVGSRSRAWPSCAAWIGEWLDSCQRLGVPVHAVTHHEYTEVNPTAAGFTDVRFHGLPHQGDRFMITARRSPAPSAVLVM